MKKYLVICFLIMALGNAHAQQDPLYSQYINNPLVLNPAVAGTSNNATANLSYRKQWNDLPGSPKTINASGQMSILRNTAGAGVMVVSDNIGNTSVTEAYAMGSYRIKVDSGTIISFGLQAGIINYKLGNNKITAFDQNDPYFQGTVSKVVPGFGAGVYLKRHNLTVGLSVPRMLRASTNMDGARFALYNQHFYAMAAYVFQISHRVLLKPAVLLKAVQGAPLSVDYNASFIMDRRYQLGLITRNLTTFGLFARAQIQNQFVIGYVFEMPTSKSVGTAYNTYEITLGYRMNALRYHNLDGDF